MGIVYCSRRDVKLALDPEGTAKNDAQIDRLIEASSRSIDLMCRRPFGFYPQIDTRTFDYPDPWGSNTTYKLWLGENEMVSISSLDSAGVTLPPTDYFLRPDNRPPANRVELNRDTSSAWGASGAGQRTISISGVFGYPTTDKLLGSLSANLLIGDTTTRFQGSEQIDIGDLLRVEDEYLQVTSKSWFASTATLFNDLDPSRNDQVLQLDSTTGFSAGATLLIDAEQMLVTAVAGTTLVVKRDRNGSTLAAHTAAGATLYLDTLIGVERGLLGTVAAGHTAKPVYQQKFPAPVSQLCIGETLDALQQEASAFARTVGSGEAEHQIGGQALAAMRKRVKNSHGRVVNAR